MDLLSLEEQRRIRKQRKGDKDIFALLQECKRLRTRYVGTELTYLNPIAEQTGRRVKILVNRLNEDAAHLAVSQGVAAMQDELTRWSRVSVASLTDISRRLRVALAAEQIEWISDVLRLAESDLLSLPEVTFRDIQRLEAALSRLGCVR